MSSWSSSTSFFFFFFQIHDKNKGTVTDGSFFQNRRSEGRNFVINRTLLTSNCREALRLFPPGPAKPKSDSLPNRQRREKKWDDEKEESVGSRRHRLLGATCIARLFRDSSHHPLRSGLYPPLQSSSPSIAYCISSFAVFPCRFEDRPRISSHFANVWAVYEGVKSFYKEDDETVPVNVYGKSKVAAEQFISEKCSNFAILRSSIIFGPQTLSPVPKSLPIQWIDGVFSKGNTSEFFHDEFRCPVYVKDVVAVILALSKRWISDGKQTKLLLNVGGPDRVSRLQMAETVADIRGYNPSLIKSVSASSVDRGVKSPADISMDITKLVQTLGVTPTSFTDGVRLTLSTEVKS